MTKSTDVDQSFYPIFSEQAQQLFRERTDKLLRAAYLRTFTDEQEKRCLKKLIFLKLVSNIRLENCMRFL